MQRGQARRTGVEVMPVIEIADLPGAIGEFDLRSFSI
jgi:hypothetical protein